MGDNTKSNRLHWPLLDFSSENRQTGKVLVGAGKDFYKMSINTMKYNKICSNSICFWPALTSIYEFARFENVLPKFIREVISPMAPTS